VGFRTSDIFPTSAQRRGRNAFAAGAGLEVDVLAAQSDSRGPVVLLFQIPNGGRVINRPDKDGEKEREFIQTKSPFDFAGVVYGRGVGIFFDAKNVAKDAHRNGLEVHLPRIVKPQQKEHLSRLGNAGAIAGILVHCGPRGDFRWLPHYALYHTESVKWDNPAWFVLGDDKHKIDFRRLVQLYLGFPIANALGVSR